MMAPSSRSVDDPENIRRFLDYANASKKGAKDASSVSANSLPAAAAAASAPSATETKQDVHNGHTAANGGGKLSILSPLKTFTDIAML